MPNPTVTPHQVEEAQEVLAAHDGNKTYAARELGISHKALNNRLKGGSGKSAVGVLSAIPETHRLGPVGTHMDADGNITGQTQWHRPNDEANNLESIVEAIESRLSAFKSKAPRHSSPRKVQSDSLTAYPMGDPHIGLYSWAEESGVDWDSDRAQEALTEATRRLVETAPATKEALILNLGDFYHADNSANQTFRSGNSLDVDTRWGRVFDIGIDTMLQCIDQALQKHKIVHVRNVIGNHDDHTAVALAKAVKLFHKGSRRVIVHDQPSFFWYHRFGKVLIGTTHGDAAKMDQLPGIMASDVPEEWGGTRHRYWYTGHIHTQTVREYPGVTVESFRTLAGRDAWHARQGYRSGRDMYSIILDREHGEVERHRVDVGML